MPNQWADTQRVIRKAANAVQQPSKTAQSAPHRFEGKTVRRQEPSRVAALHEIRAHYNAKAHEITDAITAVIINADAGLHLLRAQSPDLEEVRQVLNSIANDGKRAGDIVGRTRALMKKVIAPSQRTQEESGGVKGRIS